MSGIKNITPAKDNATQLVQSVKQKRHVKDSYTAIVRSKQKRTSILLRSEACHYDRNSLEYPIYIFHTGFWYTLVYTVYSTLGEKNMHA